MKAEEIKKAIAVAFEKHRIGVDNFNTAVFHDDLEVFIETVINILSNTKDQTEEEKWIKIYDSIPTKENKFIRIIIRDTYGEIREAFYNGRTNQFQERENYAVINKVTHWQPLPTPPKE